MKDQMELTLTISIGSSIVRFVYLVFPGNADANLANRDICCPSPRGCWVDVSASISAAYQPLTFYSTGHPLTLFFADFEVIRACTDNPSLLLTFPFRLSFFSYPFCWSTRLYSQFHFIFVALSTSHFTIKGRQIELHGRLNVCIPRC